MFEKISSSERGMTKLDWLESYHSFSFGGFYDPDKMNFGSLRVINDDFIQPGKGFPMHQHNDMEIVTIVFEGEIAHKDSEGNKEVIKADEVQRMTAGRGIFHSEFNNSDSDVLRLFQIWIMPNAKGLDPSYQQIKYSNEKRKNNLLKVVSGSKEEGTIYINQDVDIYLADLDKSISQEIKIDEGRGLYLHLIDGELVIDNHVLMPGDALKITSENSITANASVDSKLILFDAALKF
ncbi:pirin family protein [Bacteroidota bacterium]